MTTFNLNLKIDQGATYSKSVTWKTGTPPTPVDLTGCTAVMQVREKIDAPTVLLSLTTENGGIVLGGVLGTIGFYLSPTSTAAIKWRTGTYDLKITFPNGTVLRKLSGSVAVSFGVTRQ